MLGLTSSGPIQGRAESTVKCSISDAYHIIAHCFFDNYQKWCPQVVELEQLSPPPVQLGTKGRQVTRDRGIDSESLFDVTKFASNAELEITGTSEPFRSSYELVPKGNETQITFTFELKEIDLVMRPFQKLLKTALQDGAEQTAENIKSLLETGRV
jgi:hypothetical protein